MGQHVVAHTIGCIVRCCKHDGLHAILLWQWCITNHTLKHKSGEDDLQQLGRLHKLVKQDDLGLAVCQVEEF